MNKNDVKILTIDIETSPIKAWTWGPKYEANLLEEIEPSKIICFSAKWLGGTQVTKCLRDYKGYKPGIVDDKLIVEDIHKLLEECQILITQNGQAFDTKTINSRFLAHGLPPVSPYKNIDTRLGAKNALRMSSYALDDMGTYFGIGNKLHHEGFEMWKKCMAGDKKAFNLIKKYNAQDVRLTERLYLKLRPFIKNHPNLSSMLEREACPKCGSKSYQLHGIGFNLGVKFHRAQCNNCGGWFRIGKNEKIVGVTAKNI